MQHPRIWRFSVALVAIAAGTANAHPARQTLPVPQPQQRPRLVIDQSDGGFVIHCEMARGAQNSGIPRGEIPLGASVRIDRIALRPSNQKDTDHGEIR
jgi:hypothetical protein